MKTKINKSRLKRFSKNIILAAAQSHHARGFKIQANHEEEKPEPEFLIKRTFPGYSPEPKPAPLIFSPPQEKEIKSAQELKKEEIFDLGKITKFVIDRMIDSIECPGPNSPVKIKKESYTFVTDITLKEDEISLVIEKFSEEAKVPISPVFKAEAKGFDMTAIVSSTGSSFLISRKKPTP
jgi:hypothetical protein